MIDKNQTKLNVMKRKLLATLTCLLLVTVTSVYATDYSFKWVEDGASESEINSLSGNVKSGEKYSPDDVISIDVKQDGLSQSSKIWSTKVSGLSLALNNVNADGTSIGELVIFFKNGSTTDSTEMTLMYKTNSIWKLCTPVKVAPRDSIHIRPGQLVTKQKVEGLELAWSKNVWLYGIDIKESGMADGAPKMLGTSVAGGSVIPKNGELTLTFDEYIGVADISGISLADATVEGVSTEGNRLIIAYNGMTADGALDIQSSAVKDEAGNPLEANINIAYKHDNVSPLLTSVTPADGFEEMNVSDGGDLGNMIALKFNEKMMLDKDAAVAYSVSYGDDVVEMKDVTVCDSIVYLTYSNLPYNSDINFNIKSGVLSDISGNTYDKMISLNYRTIVEDGIAPVKVGQSMDNGAVDQPVNGVVSLTFDEDVKVQSQSATIDGVNVKLVATGKLVYAFYEGLGYGKNYTLTIPSGCISDLSGNVWAKELALGFATKSRVTREPDVIVGESGDYATISEALLNLPVGDDRAILYVTNGTYKEKIAVTRENVSIIGESRDGVIIEWDECASTSTLKTGTSITETGTIEASYTMLIDAGGFYGEKFTVRNSYDRNNGDAKRQAVALAKGSGDKIALKDVALDAVEDVYFSKSSTGRVYMMNCKVTGGTDILASGGTLVLDSCSVNVIRGGNNIVSTYTTDENYGVVVYNCNVASKDTTVYNDSDKAYMGRAKKSSTKAMFVKNVWGENVLNPGGWTVSSDLATAYLTADFTEWNNAFRGGSDEAKNLSKRIGWSGVMDYNEGSQINGYKVVTSENADKAWNPREYMVEPGVLLVNEEDIDGVWSLSWTRGDNDCGYLIYKNGDLWDKTVNITYNDVTRIEGDKYEVVAINEYGAPSAASFNVTSADYDVFEVTADDIAKWDENSAVENVLGDRHILKVYGLDGGIRTMGRGINVILYSDGSVEKVIVRD